LPKEQFRAARKPVAVGVGERVGAEADLPRLKIGGIHGAVAVEVGEIRHAQRVRMPRYHVPNRVVHEGVDGFAECVRNAEKFLRLDEAVRRQPEQRRVHRRGGEVPPHVKRQVAPVAIEVVAERIARQLAGGQLGTELVEHFRGRDQADAGVGSLP
jgi:hypothetical protein